jgi:N-methylhydantoinase B/oxoprolinase/acetone carboxylase alpha subunit
MGSLVLAALLVFAFAGFRQTTPEYPADAALRVAFVRFGEIEVTQEDEIAGEFAPGVDQGNVLGVERSPVELRVVVDGRLVHEAAYEPAGLRGGGRSSGVETFWLGSGRYDVEIWMRDDGTSWKLEHSGTLVIGPGQVLTLYWSEGGGGFQPLESG